MRCPTDGVTAGDGARETTLGWIPKGAPGASPFSPFTFEGIGRGQLEPPPHVAVLPIGALPRSASAWSHALPSTAAAALHWKPPPCGCCCCDRGPLATQNGAGMRIGSRPALLPVLNACWGGGVAPDGQQIARCAGAWGGAAAACGPLHVPPSPRRLVSAPPAGQACAAALHAPRPAPSSGTEPAPGAAAAHPVRLPPLMLAGSEPAPPVDRATPRLGAGNAGNVMSVAVAGE